MASIYQLASSKPRSPWTHPTLLLDSEKKSSMVMSLYLITLLSFPMNMCDPIFLDFLLFSTTYHLTNLKSTLNQTRLSLYHILHKYNKPEIYKYLHSYTGNFIVQWSKVAEAIANLWYIEQYKGIQRNNAIGILWITRGPFMDDYRPHTFYTDIYQYYFTTLPNKKRNLKCY